jgi:hypothetical protein
MRFAIFAVQKARQPLEVTSSSHGREYLLPLRCIIGQQAFGIPTDSHDPDKPCCVSSTRIASLTYPQFYNTPQTVGRPSPSGSSLLLSWAALVFCDGGADIPVCHVGAGLRPARRPQEFGFSQCRRPYRGVSTTDGTSREQAAWTRKTDVVRKLGIGEIASRTTCGSRSKLLD